MRGRTGAVAQCVKLQLFMSAFLCGVLVQNPAVLRLTQLPALRPGKAAQDGSSPCGPTTQWETQMELLAPGFSQTSSWLWHPFVQWISLTLSITLPFK